MFVCSPKGSLHHQNISLIQITNDLSIHLSILCTLTEQNVETLEERYIKLSKGG